MNIRQKIRAGDGLFWGTARRILRGILTFHVPVNGLTKPFFRLLYRVHVLVRETWIWLIRFCWNEPLFRSQCEHVGDHFRMEELPYLAGSGKIFIGHSVRLSGKSSISFGGSALGTPELLIGDGTFIGHQCGFNVGRSVKIGKNCLLATRVLVYDQDGHPLDAEKRRSGDPTPADAILPVSIGDDVWIGFDSLILKGVTIGDRSVVAAKSVVTKDVPPDVVVAGNPARIVRELAATRTDSETTGDLPRNSDNGYKR